MTIKYEINQNKFNYSETEPIAIGTHNIEMEISFTESGNWFIYAKYSQNFLLTKSNTKFQKTIYIEYSFYGDTREIYESENDDGRYDFVSKHSYIFCDLDLALGDTSLFRMDGVLYSIHEADLALIYTEDQTINLSKNEYSVKIFEVFRVNYIPCNS